MTDLKCLYVHNLAWLLPLIFSLLLYLAAVNNCELLGYPLPEFVYLSKSSPAWSFFSAPHGEYKFFSLHEDGGPPQSSWKSPFAKFFSHV